MQASNEMHAARLRARGWLVFDPAEVSFTEVFVAGDGTTKVTILGTWVGGVHGG